MWWRLFWWIVTTALTDLLQKVPPDATPAGVGDFNIPTATEGRVVPIILGGTIRINAPNCTWYGDYAAVERIQTTGVIIKKDHVIGYTYELALMYALCKNTCAGITAVWIGDEKVYEGPPVDVVDVDRDDLYGGKNQGGGFIGRIRLFNGAEDQGTSAFMASRITEGTPAYRGTAYIMVTDISETKGADIGESPNLRYMNVELQTFDTVANGALGDVLQLNNDHHFIGADANPISVAYDLFINTRWGRGLPPSDLDLPSFQAAAEVCYTEGIGFTMLVDEFTSTEEIQNWIEQHVDAYIGPDAITGQFQVNMARPDYVLANEYQADDSNVIDVRTWNKGDWSQTFNRVRMRYADRAKDWEETHAVANAPANRIIQGRLSSQEVRYPGVHSSFVANKIVAREKKNLSRPSRSGTVELNRTAWALRPGDVFSFTSVTVDETDLAVRITKVEVGDPIRNSMVVEVVEDIFDNETPTVAEPPATDFVPPVQIANPFLAADQVAFEAPYIMTRQDPVTPNVAGRLVTMARLDTGAPTSYEIRVRDPGGSGLYVSSTFITGGFMTLGVLRNTEPGTLSGNGGKTIQVDPIAGSLDGLIGPVAPGTNNMTGVAVINPDTATEEWVVFTSIVDDLAGIRLEGLYRGGLDTAMWPHVAGERIWFVWTGGFGLTDQQFAVGANIDVKLLPASPNNQVAEGDAIAMTPTNFLPTAARYYRPLLPSQVVIDGVDYNNTADLDTVYLIGAGPAAEQASALAPRLRDWRVQNPIVQFTTGLYGDVWGQDEHEISWWLYDLDVTPTPVRGNAIWSSLDIPTTFISDGGDRIPKEDLRVYMEAAGKNSFNGRLEVETSHVPGIGFSRIASFDQTFHDLTVQGTYIVPFGSTYLYLRSNGAVGAVPGDLSINNHEILQQGTDSGVSAVQAVFNQSLRAGFTNPAVSNTASGIKVRDVTPPDLKDADWTVEFRLFFAQATPSTGTHYIIGQRNSPFNWQIVYQSGTSLRIQGSTIGSTGLVNINIILATGTAPFLAGQVWHAIAVSFKTTGPGVGNFSVFINGVRQTSGAQGDVSFNIYNAAQSEVEVGISDTQRSFVSGLTGAGLIDGYLDEVRLIPGLALYGVDYTVATAQEDYDLRFSSVFQASFDKTSGDDAAVQAWIFNGAGVRLTGDQAKFGHSCLELDGGHEIGLEVGTNAGPTWNQEQRMGANDFTFEGFVRFKSLPATVGNDGYMGGVWTSSANGREWGVGVDTNGDVVFRYTIGGVTQVARVATPGAAIAIDTWYHLACVRHGRNLYVYWDGTRVINNVDEFAVGAVFGSTVQIYANLSIGKLAEDESATTTSRPMVGYVDECRLVGLTALYTGPTLTVPTAPFDKPYFTGKLLEIPTYAETSFHTHFEQSTDRDRLWYLVFSLLELEGADTATTTTDEAPGTPPAWTFNGNAQIDTAQFAIGTSSLLLDGTGDWLSTPDATTWDFLDQDFTIEAHVRWGVDPSTTQQCIISKWNNTGSNNSWAFWYNSTVLKFSYSSNGVADNTAVQGTWDPAANTWYHVAVMRRGTVTYLFVDGVLLAQNTVTTLTNTNRTSEVRIGAFGTAASELPFNGWIDQVRITLGLSRYQPFGFIVPTAAHPQLPGGDLFQDESVNGFLISGVNNPVLSAAQAKFGTTSLLLNGTDQYMTIPDSGVFEFAANDFTLQAQVRFTSLPTAGNLMTIVGKWDNNANDKEWHLSYHADNGLEFHYSTTTATDFWFTAAWSPSINTWYHVEVCRQGQFIHFFVDGVRVGVASYFGTIAIIADIEAVRVGALWGSPAVNFFDGHIDELRIIEGNGRHIADFTAPIGEYDFHRNVIVQSEDRNIWRSARIDDASQYGRVFNTNQIALVNDILPFATVPEEHGGGHPTVAHYANGNSNFSANDAGELKLKGFEFTIEMQWYVTSLATQVITGEYDNTGTSRAWWWRYNATLSALEFGWYVDGINAKSVYVDWVPTGSTWYHIAITRQGDTFRMFIDGVLQTNNVLSDTLAAGEEIIVTNEVTTVGILDATAPTQRLNGRGCDYRLMRGKALYTATFPAPTTYLQRFD